MIQIEASAVCTVFFTRALYYIYRTLSLSVLKIVAISSVTNAGTVSFSPNSHRKTTWLMLDSSFCHLLHHRATGGVHLGL
jgi:hypothetical protein